MAGYTIESSAYFNSQYGRFCHWEEPQSKGYPNPTLRHAIQDILKKLKRYSGPVDGVWGPNTIKAIQYTCSLPAAQTYGGPIDGAVGINTVYGVIEYARQRKSSLRSLPKSLSSLYGSQKEQYWKTFYQRLYEARYGSN